MALENTIAGAFQEESQAQKLAGASAFG